jgi:hypothetical protein
MLDGDLVQPMDNKKQNDGASENAGMNAGKKNPGISARNECQSPDNTVNARDTKNDGKNNCEC